VTCTSITSFAANPGTAVEPPVGLGERAGCHPDVIAGSPVRQNRVVDSGRNNHTWQSLIPFGGAGDPVSYWVHPPGDGR
jgi:hypothetical protein